MDLALNNLQWLVCHKINSNQTEKLHMASCKELAFFPHTAEKGQLL